MSQTEQIDLDTHTGHAQRKKGNNQMETAQLLCLIAHAHFGRTDIAHMK
jgi:hypothetical protein